MLLSKEELLDIKGGGISIGIITTIIGGIIFIIGVIDGYVRPYACRK